jgi:hypothetical protein
LYPSGHFFAPGGNSIISSSEDIDLDFLMGGLIGFMRGLTLSDDESGSTSEAGGGEGGFV